MRIIIEFVKWFDEITGIGDFLWDVLHWFLEFINRISVRLFSRSISEKILRKAKLRDLYYIDHITPEDIMGNRGNSEKGFREKEWLERECDKAFRRKICGSTIVVITGGYSSGKSRVVYQYLKSRDCPYKKVYIPRDIDQMVLDLKSIKSKKVEKTIIVLDDINSILKDAVDWPNDRKLKDVLGYIHNKKIKTIITLGKGAKGYLTFVRKCQDIGDDTYRGQQADTEIPVVEIESIKKGDECYRWCVGHLKNQGFSTVIGGYIPELVRPIAANLSNLTNDEKEEMFQVLASYYIYTKYRRNEGKYIDNLCKLYVKTWNKERRNFDNGFDNLLSRGFLKENLINKGTYEIFDTQLYNSFISRCMSGACGIEIKNIIGNSKEAEKMQVDVFLRLGEDSPELYPILFSRLMVHSNFMDTKEYVEKRMWIHIQDIGKEGDYPSEYLEGPISDIIRNFPDYRTAKNFIESKHITVTENIISALLAIAIKNAEDKELLIKYAEKLMNDSQITPSSIYYYHCLEKLDLDYNIERKQIVQKIFETNRSAPYNESGYAKYCETLLKKARNKRQLDYFWKEVSSDILLSPNSFTRYLKELPRNEVKDGNLCLLFSYFCEYYERVSFIGQEYKIANYEFGVFMKISQQFISYCKTYMGGQSVYNAALGWFEKNGKLCRGVDVEEAANILAIQVFKKLREKNENSERNFKDAFELLKKRLSHQWDDSEIIKITNSFIVAMPSYKRAIDMFNNIESIVNKPDASRLRIDESTINTLLTVVSNELKLPQKVEGVVDNTIKNIERIEKLRKNSNLKYNSQYNTLVYTIARLLKNNGASDQTVEKIRNFVVIPELNEDIAENARIASIINLDEIRETIANYKKEIEDDKYTDSISEVIASIIYLYMITKKFQSDIDLCDEISSLIQSYDTFVKIPNNKYYQGKLNFQLKTGEIKLESEDDRLIFFKMLSSLQKQLVEYGVDLVDNENSDLCYVAIKNSKVDVFLALKVLEHAEQKSKENPFYQNVWRARLTTVFVEKLSQVKLPAQALIMAKDELQNIINRNLYMDYSKEQGKILSIINTMKFRDKKLKDLHFGLNFPLFSIDHVIRHHVWDYYNDEQMLSSIDKLSLEKFIQREKKGIELGIVMENNYLMAATKEWQHRRYNE